MNTFLGACQDLTAADVDPATVAAAKIVYLEGYLWDPPHAKEAFVKAAEIAHQGDGRVALSLSDAFCVGRYRAEFLDLIRSGKVDILFANETELARRAASTAASSSRRTAARACRPRRSTSSSTRRGRATSSPPAS
jgi:sugar/nucleoside kinase (ribokinase family)